MTSNEQIDNALEAHGHDGWYIDLLDAALDRSDDVEGAVRMADEAFTKYPVFNGAVQNADTAVENLLKAVAAAAVDNGWDATLASARKVTSCETDAVGVANAVYRRQRR